MRQEELPNTPSKKAETTEGTKQGTQTESAHSSQLAQNFEEAADLVKTVIVSVSDLVPLFLEKWAVVKDKPVYTEIRKEQKRIKHKLIEFKKRQTRFAILLGLLLLWNLGLSVFILMKLY